MEIGTMSAAEFAQSFANQNQQTVVQQTVQTQIQPIEPQANVVEISTKSAEELAKEFENGDKNKTNEDGSLKTPEQLAEEARIKAEADSRANSGTKLDDSFKQGLELLFKEQKLSPYSDGTESGYIVPETLEEVLELIEDNKKSWIDSAKSTEKQELLEEVLASKSPAWQFLIKNAELYKDPAELVPLLTAVQNQEYSYSLDVDKEEDQEKIVRASLSLQGLPVSSIEEEIADLKDRNKLGNRAEALKPILDKYNEQQTQKILQEKQQEELKNQAFWNAHYQNLENTVFKSKEIDGVKLENEHKQLIASVLLPDEKLGGLPIYTVIDDLIAKGDFTLLAKIALLGTNEEAYNNYFLTKKADKVATTVQKVLRQSGGSNTTDPDNEPKVKPIAKKSAYGYFG